MKKMDIRWLFITFFGIIDFFSMANAQELISSAGSTFVLSEISLSWSIGEPVIENISTEEWNFTQGFQQPNGIFSSVFEQTSILKPFNVYPNPVLKTLFVEMPTDLKYPVSFQLYDTLGKRIAKGKLHKQNNQIDMAPLIHGIYFLRLNKEDCSDLGFTFSILKQ